ncbi:MAG: helix-hairpin-helix domain-containing protein [Oscillospiraceae bacterium]|nr:helix-hairpin-helix domain-containing protein [Oscillospiraceae bacterium]
MGKNRQKRGTPSGIEAVDLSVNSLEEDKSLKLREKLYIAVAVVLIIALVIGIFAVRTHNSGTFSVLIADEIELYDLSIINSATVEDFMEVSGIGEVRANAIVNFRESVGGFTDINQITYIDGISDKILESIIEYFYGEETVSEEAEE